MDELEQLHTPCILHWNLNHFVVLKKVSADSVVILDPAQGERRISRGAMGQHFTGVALELQPTTSFQQQPRPPRLRLEQLTGRVRGLAPALGSLFAVALVLECFAVAGPMFNQMIVDQAIGSHDVELLTVLALGFGVLLVVQTGLHLLRGWMVTSLTQTVSLQWVSNVFSHLMRLPVEWFERRHLGDITSRFASVQPLQRTLTTGLVEAVLDGLMVLVALTMMLLYAPQLTAIVVGAAFLYALVRWLGPYPLQPLPRDTSCHHPTQAVRP
jgi:ATP-binding cassette subfamily B protein RaxB